MLSTINSFLILVDCVVECHRGEINRKLIN